MRSLVTMLRHCFPGPTKKQVAAIAETLPIVNIKMKPDLHTVSLSYTDVSVMLLVQVFLFGYSTGQTFQAHATICVNGQGCVQAELKHRHGQLFLFMILQSVHQKDILPISGFGSAHMDGHQRDRCLHHHVLVATIQTLRFRCCRSSHEGTLELRHCDILAWLCPLAWCQNKRETHQTPACSSGQH
jgi:hypothetical protein